MLAQILAFTALGSLGSLLGAGVLLVFPQLYDRLKGPMLAFAAGMLLGATFADVLPDAVSRAGPEPVLLTVLFGLLAFFLVEKALLLRLPAHDRRAVSQAAAVGVMVGDTLHNFVDGVLVAAAFMVSVPLGVATAFAVFAHEIPHELGDFVVCIQAGWDPRFAFWLNFASGLIAVAGALAAYFARHVIEPYLPYFLAFGGASFIYIALANLVPELQRAPGGAAGTWQLAGLLGAVAVLAALHHLLG